MKRSEMKNLFLILSFFLVFSCEKKENTIVEKEQIHKIEKPKVSLTKSEIKIERFNEFRQAVYQNDLNKIKKFIDFPFKSKDAGYLIDDNFDNEIVSEENFDKFHSKIFDEMFIKSILKIKTLELLEKGETTTQDLKIGNETFRMTASFEKPDALVLNIASETFVKDLDWKPEHSRIYKFEIDDNGKLKLVQIHLAG